ncbi:Retrovirus-related Pol polyprotein from transposon opus [Thelohanellus kitauei]|uniref:Retrovirus-related Pol polyprotein from transposon opus n=1 Tax=Thelohanellus kitauei TaxID=669202 RepID=A0A0C2NGN3_THEKT|nr:Retrovirus-related Pol polyprotein from transposon opus [Thelohanellus kitauei]
MRDLNSAFYQIQIVDEDIEKTEFTLVPGMGIYKLMKMSFGLKTSLAACQRILDTLLKISKGAIVIIGDIVIFFEDFKKHIDDVRSVFEIIRMSNLKLSFKNCCFAQP